MSQSLGMLRYRKKDGLTYGIEASMISHIEPLSPQVEGCITRIFLVNVGWQLSLDSHEDLMDQYDKIIARSLNPLGIIFSPAMTLPTIEALNSL